MPATIQVMGLREFQRACSKAEKATRTEVRSALREAGAPVREHAEHLAQTQIRNAGMRWSRMKIGSTTSMVYVAPAARRAGGSPRPNFGGLLMKRALLPAVDEKRDEVIERFEKALDNVADVFERS